MARQIVTQHAVNQAAEALITEGAEPSIVAVQARIGGGSFSTVKRFLDVWKLQRTEAATAAPDTPSEVQAKGQEFASIVWSLAKRQAQADAQQAKDKAQADVAAAHLELTQAHNEISRLESIESAQAETIEHQASKLREIELTLAEAQTHARRVPDLENALADLRAELDQALKDATDKAVEAGRLAGEADALRSQVRDLMAAINSRN